MTQTVEDLEAMARKIIVNEPCLPSGIAFIRAFGTLRAAYAAAGYDRTPSELCRDAQRALKDSIAARRLARRLAAAELAVSRVPIEAE